MATKTQSKSIRLSTGNQSAEFVRQYINHRNPKANLKSYSRTLRDKNDGEDFGNSKTSYQCKVRESGEDIIYEGEKFEIDDKVKKLSFCSVKPGRDARCKADFYVVKPSKANCLVFPKTEEIKALRLKALKEWKMPLVKQKAYNEVVCDCVDLNQSQIIDYWEEAKDTRNKSVEVFESSDGVVIKFKIEEGDKAYGKLLYFIPSNIIKGKVMPLKEDENLFDKNTWR